MPIQLQLGETPEPIDPAVEREKRRSARFWTVTAFVVCALTFVMVLRLYAFEATLVTSGSMEDTLFKGDYALFDHRIALRNRWNRGDIVIFESPQSWAEGGAEGGGDEGNFEEQTLVKRVIGLPGETVGLLNGDVYINGKLLNQGYLKEKPLPDTLLPIRLGTNQYYVMGDNRNNSDDSRNNGPISEKDIKGRIMYKLWPLAHFGSLPTLDYGGLATNN